MNSRHDRIDSGHLAIRFVLGKSNHLLRPDRISDILKKNNRQ